MSAENLPVPATKTHSGLAWFFGAVGTFLIVGGLVWAMRHYTKPPPLGEDRVAVRTKALAELRAVEQDALTTFGWVDKAKGQVRLRIPDAMDLVLRQWQNPPAARSNLLERVNKFNPPPPPAAPQKPSEFE